MHVAFVSDCTGRALKRTRAVLDSYAVRIGESSWSSPITQQALSQVLVALNRIATRQTAVACYLNDGRRGMRLLWIVGSKTAFGPGGHFRAGTTRRGALSPARDEATPMADWIRIAAMLARAAGLVHDIGKASERFQQKLRTPQLREADDVRHEWISMRVLQQMRANSRDWNAAWAAIAIREDHFVRLGDRLIDASRTEAVSTAIEAIDFLVVSHHGLLQAQGSKDPSGRPVLPTPAERHVRKWPPEPSQMRPAGDIGDEIFDGYWKLEARLRAAAIDPDHQTHYWRSVSILARAALIFADHSVSRRRVFESQTESALFANTSERQGTRCVNQTLDWHLRKVGELAGAVTPKIAALMDDASLDGEQLPGLSPSTLERIAAPADPDGRFAWQNRAADALEATREANPGTPVLVLNMAGTGAGKTRMNLRAATLLSRTDSARVSVALNLRSLTLQTGSAMREAFGLDAAELAVVIGEAVVQKLFDETRRGVAALNDDENPPDELFTVAGEAFALPEWLCEIIEPGRQTALLGSPILVSTIDFLIAAGNPGNQGHHVRALLRLISSDLVLDEIDSYEPEPLAAVLRLVQLAAFAGRNVICSSATLALPVARAVEHAWRSGISMREALLSHRLDADHQTALSVIALIDDQLPPRVLRQDAVALDDAFEKAYSLRLAEIALHLESRPAYRLARLQPIRGTPSTTAWRDAVVESITSLHSSHGRLMKVPLPDGSTTEKRVSVGLVRVANIGPAIDTARHISRALGHSYVACYHSAHFLIARFHIERRLDGLLSRGGAKDPVEVDAEILNLAASSSSDSIVFIVVATPVEEIGRDHDFDWAVIDASSAQSIVQTAGRVNRHRLTECAGVPNIHIPEFNRRHCDNAGDAKSPAFVWPGYEEATPLNASRHPGRYGSHSLGMLLPWDDCGQLVIDARLRFDSIRCRLAAADDHSISRRLETFFGSRGVFVKQPTHAWILTDGRAGPYAQSALRSAHGHDLVVRVLGNEPQLEFQRQERVESFGRLREVWVGASVGQLEAEANAWLSAPPSFMNDLCEQTGIGPEEGMRVSLTEYPSSSPKAAERRWIYDLGFGLQRLALQ